MLGSSPSMTKLAMFKFIDYTSLQIKPCLSETVFRQALIVFAYFTSNHHFCVR